MPAPIQSLQTLFNPDVGIQSLLQTSDASSLPDAREIGASAVRQSTLAGLYGPQNARSRIEGFLAPNVGDGMLVSPEVFARRIRSATEKLAKRGGAKGRAIAHEELATLLENNMLVAAYRGLMLGG